MTWMTYFEVRDRLENLTEFRKLYVEYIGFTNREGNVPAQMVRHKMEPLVPMAVDSLRRIGLGGMVTRDAPVRGGKKIRVNIIKAIFRDHVVRQFSLDDDTPLKALDLAIVKYQKQLWVQKLQLFNPLFWFFQFVSFAAQLPILICKRAGIDTEEAEESVLVRLYLVAVQVIAFYLLAEWSGLIDWIWIDILNR